jgi:hypothetical protein
MAMTCVMTVLSSTIIFSSAKASLMFDTLAASSFIYAFCRADRDPEPWLPFVAHLICGELGYCKDMLSEVTDSVSLN